jgi:hypothetical protein
MASAPLNGDIEVGAWARWVNYLSRPLWFVDFGIDGFRIFFSKEL